MTADLLILIGFLLLNVIVGFRYRGKSKSFREYAIGDKKFSTATLTATVVATWIGGNIFFNYLERFYDRGLYYVIPSGIGGTACLLITGYVIGPRMGKFLDSGSVPDLLGKLYGRWIQAIAGVSTVLYVVGYIAWQFKVIVRILSIFLNPTVSSNIAGLAWNEQWVTFIIASLIIFYATSGGVKAVTFTDVIQFCTFGTLLPVLALVVWHNLKDPTQVVSALTHHPNFSFSEVFRWSPEFVKSMVYTIYLLIPGLSPELFQRIVMARDVQQIKSSLGYSSVIYLAVKLCLLWIAIMLIADQPSLKSSELVKYLVNTYTYPGFRGFLCVGVIAMGMSTADSLLNACAVIVANDIAPLFNKNVNQLNTAKWATLILGYLAVVVALRTQDFLTVLLFSANFYTPVVLIPALLAIFGFETSRRVVYMAMGSGVATVLACLFYFKTVDGFLPGMVANLATMLVAHYWLKEKGGWGNNPLPISYHTQPRSSRWRQSIRQFRFTRYLEKYLPQHNQAYPLLGFYIFTTTYASLYLLPQEIVIQHPVLYKTIYYSVTLITTLLFTFPIWPQGMKNKRLLTWIWPSSIFYTLFFVGSLLTILSSFQLPQLMLLMLNLVMAILFLNSAMALTMFMVGLGAAIYLLHWALILGDLPGINVGLQFRFIYVLLLFSSSLIALFIHKQSYQDVQERNLLLRTTQKETNKALLNALKHRAQLGQVMRDESMSMFTSVQEISEKLEKETHHLRDVQATTAAQETIQQAKVKIKAAATYFGQIIYQLSAYMRLHVSTISLKKLIKESLKDLKYKLDPSSSSQIIVQYDTQQSQIQCDAKAIQQIVVDGLDYAQQHARDQQPILLGITDTTLGYPITAVPGYTKKVAALCITITTERTLPTPLELYMGEVSNFGLSLLKAHKALPIIQNERIVEEHYGAVEFVENKHDCTQIYVIPLRLREVRPETMDAPDMDANAPKVSHDLPVYPQEEEILKTIAMYPEIDRAIVQKAVQLIKTYHAGVKRKSGEPFYLHPIAVAQILLKYTKDQDTIIAALLHDTVEDTSLSLSQIEGLFNETVQCLVDGVTHLESDMATHKRIQLSTHENILQLLGVKDERILYIKLADRLHNMRTIKGHPSLAKQKKIAEETLHFFVPIARHIKLHAISEELQQLSSEVLSRVS